MSTVSTPVHARKEKPKAKRGKRQGKAAASKPSPFTPEQVKKFKQTIDELYGCAKGEHLLEKLLKYRKEERERGE